MQAAERLEPARLSWGSGVVDFVMNRREFTPDGIILGVNPRGLADRSVPVLRVDAADGKPRAVLFGAATHNTTLGRTTTNSAATTPASPRLTSQEHYPGRAGDVHARLRRRLESLSARHHGDGPASTARPWGEEVCRVLERQASSGAAGR